MSTTAQASDWPGSSPGWPGRPSGTAAPASTPRGVLLAARASIEKLRLTRRLGWVREMQGLAIDAEGLHAAVGELCRIRPRTDTAEPSGRRPDAADAAGVLAEVVGIKPGRVTLMAYGALDGIAAGSEVHALGAESQLGVSHALLGRVVDAFGRALDGMADPAPSAWRPLKGQPIGPMQRPPIDRVFETGVRCIDALLTLGHGQRIGIFAGSGVGKSTLLGMLARHAQQRPVGGEVARVNVFALIGERGREVREFVEQQLGPAAMARSVVVVATADQAALARVRAAHAALTIAEYFRDLGHPVLLTMDSITRLAMARREIGLSAGEPPTARGYTPSVFAELPMLCERCGTAPGGGSITALFTVLVEGDDFNEPISDAMRAILDGHVVLSRALAHRGHYPAIDVLRSVSRLMPLLASSEQRSLAVEAQKQLALVDKHRPLVDVGAYEAGSNPELDRALALDVGLERWLQQDAVAVSRDTALQALAAILKEPAK